MTGFHEENTWSKISLKNSIYRHYTKMHWGTICVKSSWGLFTLSSYIDPSPLWPEYEHFKASRDRPENKVRWVWTHTTRFKTFINNLLCNELPRIQACSFFEKISRKFIFGTFRNRSTLEATQVVKTNSLYQKSKKRLKWWSAYKPCNN